MTRAYANSRSSWKQFFHIQMPLLSALYSDQETRALILFVEPVGLQPSRSVSFLRVLSPRGVRSSFCFHHVWAQTYPSPGKATLQTRSSPVVHILRAGLGHRAARRPGGSPITCAAKPETGSGRTMRKNCTCAGGAAARDRFPGLSCR